MTGKRENWGGETTKHDAEVFALAKLVKQLEYSAKSHLSIAKSVR